MEIRREVGKKKLDVHRLITDMQYLCMNFILIIDTKNWCHVYSNCKHTCKCGQAASKVGSSSSGSKSVDVGFDAGGSARNVLTANWQQHIRSIQRIRGFTTMRYINWLFTYLLLTSVSYTCNLCNSRIVYMKANGSTCTDWQWESVHCVHCPKKVVHQTHGNNFVNS